jgi:hypothetical protein
MRVVSNISNTEDERRYLSSFKILYSFLMYTLKAKETIKAVLMITVAARLGVGAPTCFRSLRGTSLPFSDIVPHIFTSFGHHSILA